MHPLISIILPTYNGAQTINNAIASVVAQTYPHWELIVVSDGSTDTTKALVGIYAQKDTRIFFVENEKNLGIQKTLNKGVAIAKGEYIARIDDDDVWSDPAKLAIQVAFLESNSDHVLIGTDSFVVDEKGTILSANILPKTDRAIRTKILSKNCFLHSTILARKSAIKKAGGYGEEVATRHVEDYDLWLKLGLMGKMANLEMKSSTLTAHSNSLTSRNRSTQAKHALQVMLKNRKRYPRFLTAFFISVVRLVFFWLLSVIPIRRTLWYRIQRIYRSV